MITDRIKNRIKELYDEGWKTKDISDELGVSEPTARKYSNQSSPVNDYDSSYDYSSYNSNYSPPMQNNPSSSPPNYNPYASVAPIQSPQPIPSQQEQQLTMFYMNMMQKQSENLSMQIQNMQNQKREQEKEIRENILRRLEKPREANNDFYRLRLEEKVQKLQNEIEEGQRKYIEELKAEDPPQNINSLIEKAVSKNFKSDVVTRERANEIFEEVTKKYQDKIDSQQSFESSKIAMFRERNDLTLKLAQLEQQDRKGNVWSSILQSVVETLGNGIPGVPDKGIESDIGTTPAITENNGLNKPEGL